jgi:flagellar hook-associated protein 2
MAEIFIPGVSSRFDTGKTVERLVELEGRRLKKLEKERDALLLEQKVWGKLNAELLVLKQAAMKLYGVRTPFKELAAVFESDRYFLAEVLPGANLGKKSVEVLELASVSRVTSDPLGRDASIPAGRFVITTGGRDIPVDWPGGPPAALVTLINSVGKDAVLASLIKKGEDGFLLVLESAKTGGENALRFTDTDGVLEKIGVLGRAVTQSFRDDFDVNRTTPLPGTPAGSVSLSQGQLVLEPGASVEPPRRRYGERRLRFPRVPRFRRSAPSWSKTSKSRATGTSPSTPFRSRKRRRWRRSTRGSSACGGRTERSR